MKRLVLLLLILCLLFPSTASAATCDTALFEDASFITGHHPSSVPVGKGVRVYEDDTVYIRRTITNTFLGQEVKIRVEYGDEAILVGSAINGTWSRCMGTVWQPYITNLADSI